MQKYCLRTSVCSLLVSVFFILSCRGQTKTPAKDSLSGGLKIHPKIIKNYFITRYPEEFFFVQCGLQDKAGNMWFGTAGNGINYYTPALGGFINFTKQDGLCHNDILCCAEDKAGNIWFGTRNGLIRYKPSGAHPARKDFSSFLISANVISASDRKKIPYTYQPADNFVWSILQDNTGKLWFGTNKGVYIHDPLTDAGNDPPLFTQFFDNNTLVNKNNLHLKDIQSMVQDTKGNIWFASGYIKGEGICRYDGKSITNFKPDSISSFREAMVSKNGDVFFLDVYRGAYVYDGKTFTNFTKKLGINDTIRTMLEDKAGNIWFGTNSDNMYNGGTGGVWRYDPSATNGNSLKLFTTKDGLSHNCVLCIVEDRDRNVWFGTRFTGLCRYDGKSFTDYTDRPVTTKTD
ncbi:MAG: hypothetical protein K0S33_3857 [Bacteroidetes bacterium]|jgi:ligand-binding sensor domain-containing protein|nr:hypothetical protein [Bacteroidota bacterium]